MSREREKGTRFETQVAAYLTEVLGTDAHRLGMGGTNDRGDVHVDGLSVTVECKNCQRMELAKWVDEAARESANAGTTVGAVAHHRKGCGVARIADSYVTLRLGDFAALLLMILRKE